MALGRPLEGGDDRREAAGCGHLLLFLGARRALRGSSIGSSVDSGLHGRFSFCESPGVLIGRITENLSGPKEMW